MPATLFFCLRAVSVFLREEEEEEQEVVVLEEEEVQSLLAAEAGEDL